MKNNILYIAFVMLLIVCCKLSYDAGKIYGTQETISGLKSKTDSICAEYEKAIARYNYMCETIALTELYKQAERDKQNITKAKKQEQ